MTDPKAHDPRAVEALAVEVEWAGWPNCGREPGCQPMLASRRIACMILSREAALEADAKRLAAAERERDEARAERMEAWRSRADHDERCHLLNRPSPVRPILYTDEVGGQQVCVDNLWAITTTDLNALNTASAERDALRAQVAKLRPWALFGAWAFEEFWHDSEPGDIDGADAQEKAVECGLLARTSVCDAGATHAEGCDWQPGMPNEECCCYSPCKPPLAATAPEQGQQEGM